MKCKKCGRIMTEWATNEGVKYVCLNDNTIEFHKVNYNKLVDEIKEIVGKYHKKQLHNTTKIEEILKEIAKLLEKKNKSKEWVIQLLEKRNEIHKLDDFNKFSEEVFKIIALS